MKNNHTRYKFLKIYSSATRAAIFLCLVAGCASAPDLERYPRATIDRPYTLPSGVAAWDTIAILSYDKDDSGSDTIPPIGVPLFWRTSLADNWTLNWSPLPLGISHQLSYSRDRVLGASLGTGVGYSRL